MFICFVLKKVIMTSYSELFCDCCSNFLFVLKAVYSLFK